jgi:LysM repeat protein
MRDVQQAFLGFFMAVLFTAIIVGSISLSMVESGIPIAQAPTRTGELYLPQQPKTTAENGSPSGIEEPALVVTPATPQPTETFAPPTNCPPPKGWVSVVVQPGDTLVGFARMFGVRSGLIAEANCLLFETLLPDTILYLPDFPPPTQPVSSCGAPYGWVIYIVRSGDTLSKIAIAYGTTVAQLQSANCMGNSSSIVTGQQLYVPNTLPAWPTPVPTRTPTRTPTLPVIISSPTDTLGPPPPPLFTASPTDPIVLPPSSLTPTTVPPIVATTVAPPPSPTFPVVVPPTPDVQPSPTQPLPPPPPSPTMDWAPELPPSPTPAPSTESGSFWMILSNIFAAFRG